MKQIPEEIRDYLSYNPDTGELTWIKKKVRSNVGDVAGSVGKHYSHIKFNQVLYYSHRIAWFLHTGEQPLEFIDHIDGDKLNNTFTNLREATHSNNKCNVGLTAKNTSGYKGVSWAAKDSVWIARIMKAGANHHLGSFNTPEEAYLAYCKAADELHKEFKNYV